MPISMHVLVLFCGWYPMARSAVAVRCVLTVFAATAGASEIYAQAPQIARQPMSDSASAAHLITGGGRIVVQRNNSPWRLEPGEMVYPNEVVTTGDDGWGMFKVSDGSTFEIYPDSKIAFRTNRGNWEDLLELWLGKVKVQIEHPGGLPNNNKVRTPTAVISVRGTTFDVEYKPDDDSTTVLDEEGSVEVASVFNLDNKKLLNANEMIVVYKNTSLARRIDTGGIFKRVFQSAMDALTQQAINSRTSAPAAPGTPAPPATTGGSPGDKNNSPTPPPPPPPPPPPAPAQ
jgi:ferric-dicitrate binding protein FerR (iron transport regulator)